MINKNTLRKLTTVQYSTVRSQWIYIFLFFLLGLNMERLPGLVMWGHLPGLVLIAVYVLHHGILKRNRAMERSFMVFFIGCTLFILQEAILNLYELLRNGSLPFHKIYTSSGLRMLAVLCERLLRAYILFRCFQRDTKNGILFRAYAWGSIIFLVMLFWGVRNIFSEGGRLELWEEGRYVFHPNRVAYLFLWLFYMNALAVYYARLILAKICHLTFCVAAIAIIILTQSRTSIVALFLGLGFVWCFSWRRYLMTILIVLLGCAFLYMNSHYVDSILHMLPQRYTLQAVEGISGRRETWGDYLNFMTVQDFLVGCGMFAGETSVLYQKPLHTYNDTYLNDLRWGRYFRNSWDRIFKTHNLYLQTTVIMGIGGVMFYCYLVLKIFFRLLTKTFRRKLPWIYVAMWCSFLIWHCTEYDFLENMFIYFWALALSQSFSQIGDNSIDP